MNVFSTLLHTYRVRLLGLLFLLVMLFYGLGQHWLQGQWMQGKPIAGWQWLLGVIFQVANAVSVVAMAFLMRPWLHSGSSSASRCYTTARIAEALLLLGGLAVFLTTQSPADSENGLRSMRMQEGFYHAAMLALGLGSIPMLRALKANGSLPSWLVYWGLAGYASLAAGACWNWWQQSNVLEWSYVGGLFEIFLGVRLLTRGFSPQ